MKTRRFMSAAQAAEALGISLPTLYAYVSRGLIRSEEEDKSKRTRRYYSQDIQRLKERQEMRRDPQKVVDTALHWGTAMLDSALTLIDNGHLYYRGRDVLDLAIQWRAEQAAALLWTGEEQQANLLFSSDTITLPNSAAALTAHLADAPAIVRMQSVLPVLAQNDLAAYDFRPEPAARAGARILRHLTLLAANPHGFNAEDSIAVVLRRAWVPHHPEAAALFNTALILCADHELNVSSFTARCIASAGSPPYAVVLGGLAALQGVKHGGATERVEALLREMVSPDRAAAMLAQRIRRGEAVPGFGHRLYPDGDPRGRLLMERVASAYPESRGLQSAMALAEAAWTALHQRPNIDFGLATLCTALELPAGAAITLFALGRTIGWIGHAIEEYQADRLIRPRAHYTGVLPPDARKT